MKKLTSVFLCCAAGFAALLSTACSSVRYSGETEAKLDSGTPVSVFMEENTIRSEYRVLGTAEYEAPSGLSSRQIWDVMKDAARKNGANGILVISADKVPCGAARTDQLYNSNAPGWTVGDDTVSSRQLAQDTIEYASKKDPVNQLYRMKIKAQFLVLPRKLK